MCQLVDRPLSSNQNFLEFYLPDSSLFWRQRNGNCSDGAVATPSAKVGEREAGWWRHSKQWWCQAACFFAVLRPTTSQKVLTWKRSRNCITMVTSDRRGNWANDFDSALTQLQNWKWKLSCHCIKCLRQRHVGLVIQALIGAGERFKKAYELLNLRPLKISPVDKMHIFRCMGKIFCVEFQRGPLKFHTKYLTHKLKDAIFRQRWHFKSSWS